MSRPSQDVLASFSPYDCSQLSHTPLSLSSATRSHFLAFCYVLCIGWAHGADRCFDRRTAVSQFVPATSFPFTMPHLFSPSVKLYSFSWLPVLCSLVVGANAYFWRLESLFKFVFFIPSRSFIPMTDDLDVQRFAQPAHLVCRLDFVVILSRTRSIR
jgi:hypothetical protein